MSKFKVGDRVRLNEDYDTIREGLIKADTVGVIANIVPVNSARNLITVRRDEDKKEFDAFDYRFSLVRELTVMTDEGLAAEYRLSVKENDELLSELFRRGYKVRPKAGYPFRVLTLDEVRIYKIECKTKEL